MDRLRVHLNIVLFSFTINNNSDIFLVFNWQAHLKPKCTFQMYSNWSNLNLRISKMHRSIQSLLFMKPITSCRRANKYKWQIIFLSLSLRKVSAGDA